MTEFDPDVAASTQAEAKPARKTPVRKRKTETSASEEASAAPKKNPASKSATAKADGSKSGASKTETAAKKTTASKEPRTAARKTKPESKASAESEAPAAPAKPKRRTTAKKSSDNEVPAAPPAVPGSNAPPQEWSPGTGQTDAPKAVQPEKTEPKTSEKAPAKTDSNQPPASRDYQQDNRGRGNRRRGGGRRNRSRRGGRRDDAPRDEPYVYRPPKEGSSFGNGPIETEPDPEEEQAAKPTEEKSDEPAVIRYETQYGEGVVEISGKGFGFLREQSRNFGQSPQDIFVTPEVIRKHSIRDGMWLRGEVRRGSRGYQLFKLSEIEGEAPGNFLNMPLFEELTVINPIEQLKMETTPDRFTTRVIDMMTPVGKGQRGLIVAPPRTGKTTLLQHIAEAMTTNHPDVKLIILLVDERPEEVTELSRAVPKAEIMASSNDSDLKSHTHIAQLAIERAKRLVEASRDVFILLDSITRVGRAFNNATQGSGRTLSGGMDARAMEIPRRLFSGARNTEEGGSLTILGTALVETGSRMDDLIFQEFKGTGNMELVLDRKIAEQRVYPAVDIFGSGTRREELLIPAHHLEKINIIRRGLADHRPIEAIERLLGFLIKFPTNEQLLDEIPR